MRPTTMLGRDICRNRVTTQQPLEVIIAGAEGVDLTGCGHTEGVYDVLLFATIQLKGA